MDKIRDWLLTYKRHYISNLFYVYCLLFFVVTVLLAYWLGYVNGWDDSYELFDKIRPHRPLLG